MGQSATDEKSNEITAIPDLLDQIEVKNAVVTIDAAGCQKSIAQKTVSNKRDHVLPSKLHFRRTANACSRILRRRLKAHEASIWIFRFSRRPVKDSNFFVAFLGFSFACDLCARGDDWDCPKDGRCGPLWNRMSRPNSHVRPSCRYTCINARNQCSIRCYAPVALRCPRLP